MMRLVRSIVALLLIMLAACAGDMRRQQLETQLSALPPDQALELLAQQSAQYPDDLQIRSEYLQMRRRVMEDYLTRATTAYYANDLAQARAWVQKAQQAAPGDDSAGQMLEWIDTQGPIDSAVQYAESIRTERPDEALAIANDVLRRQPSNGRAARLRDDLLTPRGRELTPTLTRDLSQPITVQFRDQPLISIFELVSNITGLNFTFDHDVAATAPTTIFATNTPVKQVMAMVLQANQLSSKVVNGTSLLIYPKRQDKESEYRDLAVRTFYLQNAQAPQVLAVLKQMVKTRDAVVDERTNAIIMRDAPETIAVAERLIAAMDVTPAEVVIEAQIIEVSSTDLLQLGIRYPDRIEFAIRPTPDQTDTTTLPAGFVTLDELHHLNSSDVIVRLGTVGIDWLQSMGKTKTLANPRIRVRNREKAKVLIGDRLPVVTTTLSSNFSSESINYQDVGLTLDVQPSIVNSREVQVKLKLEVSNVTDTITTSSGLVAYQIGTRTAETVMSVNNNETQILAGLLQRNERSGGQGIPGLSRIPILDRIFGTKVDDDKQTELILLLTPRIVRNQSIPAGNAVAFDSGTETRITTEGNDLTGGAAIKVPPKGMNTPPPALEAPGGKKP
ncbi:secretin N-terminal domain-containing protein [Paraburkholderia sp. SOS3]|uniref:secretin N-terminal domain-containing protein n=1 Tax=Paraburkholderia sp. SOS3 TaxID=1926494 RepID=UPI0009FAABFA|nr:secretin N-terminal domain-containing protein [Paraburkholderia sp. SOS3]